MPFPFPFPCVPWFRIWVESEDRTTEHTEGDKTPRSLPYHRRPNHLNARRIRDFPAILDGQPGCSVVGEADALIV